nr:MAG TPA: hypothetical protein [Caudoviricetes sp.]
MLFPGTSTLFSGFRHWGYGQCIPKLRCFYSHK